MARTKALSPNSRAKAAQSIAAAVKKADAKQKPYALPTKTYRVIYRMWDHHNGADSPHDETVGRFASEADARECVRSYLHSQWDPSFFDSYEEFEEGEESGGFEVYAECPEGEEIWVYMEEEEPLQRPSGGVIDLTGTDDEDEEDEEDEEDALAEEDAEEQDELDDDEPGPLKAVYFPVMIGREGERRVGTTAYASLADANVAAYSYAQTLDSGVTELPTADRLYRVTYGEGEGAETVAVVQMDIV